MPNMSEEKIAIVGRGIAGLFCALILEQQGKAVTVFEASHRIGGRIRTIRLDKNNKELTKEEWSKNKLEFYAEFGPMRIETDKQLLLKALLDFLGIKTDIPGDDNKPVPYLKEFPSYSSPASTHDPRFELEPEEIGKSSLELLRMALCA